MRHPLSLLAVLVGVNAALAAEPAKKPNVVFCFADDWGRYASCYAALDAKPTANSVVNVVALVGVASAAEPVKRPNIVWIFVDDMSANFSCYGEKTIQTPHVDRMA